MSSTNPIIRRTAWISLIPQLAVMAVLIGVYYFAGARQFVMYGAFTYLALSFTLRNFVAAKHTQGVALIKRSQFSNAIPMFEDSYELFSSHPWLDKYRYLFMLSSSAVSYREMALSNIAFCYVRDGDLIRGKEYYEKALAQFPGSELAINGLEFIQVNTIKGSSND